MGYSFIDLGDLSCAEIARLYSELLIGRIAINTSFDSGRLSPAEYREFNRVPLTDWHEFKGYAVTPKITRGLIDAWPVSHDEFYDEWWVFENAVPPTFKVRAFCNFAMPIGQYKRLDWDEGVPLDRYLQEFAPIAVFGNNESAYLIRQDATTHSS